MEDLSEVLRKLATRNTSADNAYALTPEPEGPVCERCGGRGWFTADVPVGHPTFGQVVTCDCQQQRMDDEQHTRLLRYSNLGHMARFTFDSLAADGREEDPESRKAFVESYEAALAYSDRPAGWLVFTGPHGSGKTHLAAAIGNRCIENGHVVFFVHVPDLLDHLRATFAPASDVTYSELFEQVKSTPLLVLDDLGGHSATPWAQEKLRQIVNHRYNAELPTVFTTVAGLDELDQYVLSRVQTGGLSRILEMPGPTRGRSQQLGRIQPQLLGRMTFETFDVRGNNPNESGRASLEGAFQAASNFAADPDGWLTLMGDTGVGKTHLAVAIAAQHHQKGNPIFFVFVPDLLDYLRFAYSPESTITYDAVLDEVRNTPLLILDDLGREHTTRWAAEKLYQIVAHRYNARAPTVITAVSELAEVSDPIASRIKDPSIGQLIRIDAPDYRNKGRTADGSSRAGARRKPRC